MENNTEKTTTSYRYIAKNASDYNALTSFVIGSACVCASLFPSITTVVISPRPEDGDIVLEFAKFIDKEGLDISMEPIEVTPDMDSISCFNGPVDADTLYEVIRNLHRQRKELREKYDADTDELIRRNEKTESLKHELEEAKDRYFKWYQEAQQQNSELCDFMKAIRTMIDIALKK